MHFSIHQTDSSDSDDEPFGIELDMVDSVLEGYFDKEQSVILVEDLISSGKSSLEAAATLKEVGMNVKGIISIFTYGFDAAAENFKNADCEHVSLCDYNTLLTQAIKSQYIEKSDLSILKEWRENPVIWGK